MSTDSAHELTTADEIKSAIPHREPMLLVDDILHREGKRIVCSKTFHPEEFFVQGHFPDQAVVPGVILCEAVMQAGAIMLASDDVVIEDCGIPIVTRLNDVKFRKMVYPGDTVELHAELVERLGKAFFMKAKVVRDDVMVMRCEFACSIATP